MAILENPKFNSLIDSLKIEINFRILDAKKIPKGLGRQFDEKNYRGYPYYTPGDLYDKNGKRVYLKPADE